MKNNIFKPENLQVGRHIVTLIETFLVLIDGIKQSVHGITNKRILPALYDAIIDSLKGFDYKAIKQFAKAVKVCRDVVAALKCAEDLRTTGCSNETIKNRISETERNIISNIRNIFTKKFKSSFIQEHAINYLLDGDYFSSYRLDYGLPSKKQITSLTAKIKAFPFEKYGLENYEKELQGWLEGHKKTYADFNTLVEIYGDDIINWQTTNKFYAVCRKQNIDSQGYYLYNLIRKYKEKLEAKGLKPAPKKEPKELELDNPDDLIRGFKAGKVCPEKLSFDQLIELTKEETKVVQKRRTEVFYLDLVLKAIEAITTDTDKQTRTNYYKQTINALENAGIYGRDWIKYPLNWKFFETFANELSAYNLQELLKKSNLRDDFAELSPELVDVIFNVVSPTDRLTINSSISHACLKTLSADAKLEIFKWQINKTHYSIDFNHSAPLFIDCGWNKIRKLLLDGCEDWIIKPFVNAAIENNDQEVLFEIAKDESESYFRKDLAVAYKHLDFETKCKLVKNHERYSNHVVHSKNFWSLEDLSQLKNIVFDDSDFAEYIPAVQKVFPADLSDLIIKGKVTTLPKEYAAKLNDKALVKAIKNSVFDGTPYAEIQERFDRKFIEAKLNIDVAESFSNFPKLLTEEELTEIVAQLVNSIKTNYDYDYCWKSKAKFLRDNLELFTPEQLAPFADKNLFKALVGDQRSPENRYFAEKLSAQLVLTKKAG